MSTTLQQDATAYFLGEKQEDTLFMVAGVLTVAASIVLQALAAG